MDRNPHISSTALLCALHMASTKPDLVRRWIGEITECISSKHSMVMMVYVLKIVLVRSNFTRLLSSTR